MTENHTFRYWMNHSGLVSHRSRLLISFSRHRCNDTHPLHPRMLEDLSSTEAQGGIPNQQFGYEILGHICDVSPVLVWKLILALLDALKQMTLNER